MLYFVIVEFKNMVVDTLFKILRISKEFFCLVGIEASTVACETFQIQMMKEKKGREREGMGEI